jgi:hypothetical protein
MQDERIQATANRIAGRGFFIWYWLMLISLYYRMFFLKQHIRDFWDIAAIFFIGTFFVFIAYANKGVLDCGFKRRVLTLCIVLFTVFCTWHLIAGHWHSLVDVGTSLLGFLAGTGLWIGIAYFLSRRWKRKEGIEDEK